MELGMYSPEIKRRSLPELFQAAAGYGFRQMQFNYTSAGLEELPDRIPDSLVSSIRREADFHNIKITALNGTFNMVHPDEELVKECLKRFEALAASCKELGCNLITLCTGTRNPKDAWVWHPDNETEETWAAFRRTLDPLIDYARKYNIYLGIEPEVVNVIDSADKACRLFEEVKSERIRIIMDVANMVPDGAATPENIRRIMEDAFSRLGKYTYIVHGKDIMASVPGEETVLTSAGRGILDYRRLVRLMEEYGCSDSLILHGMRREEEFSDSLEYIRAIV